MNTINLDDEVCCELTAFYSSSSKWELDFDLNDTYNWYVKWDTLYVQHKESDSDFEEYEDIKWALIDFMDQGFDLRVKKYDNPEEIEEMTIAMNAYLPADEDLITGNNEIKGSVEDGNIGDLKVKTIFNPTELLRTISSLNGKDREWTENLESACLRLIDLEGYDHASFRIDKTRIPSSENVSVNIHIHLMKNPE